MNRAWIRLAGLVVSVVALVTGKNAEAIIDTSVYMQCETNGGNFSEGSDVHSNDGGVFKWAACDDGWSNYIYANGTKLMGNGKAWGYCKDYEGIQPIFTGLGEGNLETPCYCSNTGIACPDIPAWRKRLAEYGCVENGSSDLYEGGCYFFENKRGLYLLFSGCQEGYAETTGLMPKYEIFTGLEGWLADPTGYCYLCPGLGYDGDSFYLTTGMSPSGQFSWGAGPQSGDGCQAKVNGSLTNSKGTFTVSQPCVYDEYYYE